MSRIFVSELKRAMNAGVLLAMIGVMFCICFDSWNELIGALKNSDTPLCVYYFMENSAFGGMCRTYILPVFAALPFATSFCEEKNSRAVAYIASREGMRNYGVVKYAVNVMAGGVAVAAGTVLLMLLLRTRFQMTNVHYAASGAADPFHQWLAVHHPFYYCMTQTAFGFMRGMIWAGLSMFASLYIADKLVITLFPFFGSYVIVRASQMLLIDNGCRFDLILIGRTVIQNSGYTVMIATVISGVLVFAVGYIFTKKMIRGLRNGTLYQSK